MKRFRKAYLLTVVVLTMLLCFVFSASAADGSGKCGENVFWSFDVEAKTLTISGTGPMDDYELISDGAIEEWVYCTAPFDVEGGIIDTVIIEDGVTSVGTLAFYDFNIKNLIIADSVKVIKESAFYENTRLKTLNLGNGLEVIEESAFYYCRSALESVVLPESLTTIEGGAFGYCTALKEVQISKNLSDVSAFAFSNCDKLEKFIVDEENPYFCDIDGVLFSKDKKTLVCYPEGKEGVTYSVPDGVTDIGKGAFSGNYVLESVTLPDSLLNIGNGAFYKCKLGTIDLPEGLLSIGNHAFGYGNIKEIVFPESLETIGNRAFESCDLTEVAIPSNVKYIGSTAFSFCEKLERITVDEANEYYCSDSFGVLYNKDKSELIKYPDGITASAYVIFDGVSSIAEEAVYDTKFLKTITIPTSVKKISRYGICSSSFIDVCYKGTKEQWDAIDIAAGGTGWHKATLHYNSNHEIIGRPESVTAIVYGRGLILEWTRVPDVYGYRVYMKTENGWKHLGDTTFTYFRVSLLEPLTEYTFAVRAGRKIDGKNVLSDTYTVFTTKTVVSAPANLKATQTTSEIKLTWTPSEGATGYRIYRQIVKGPWNGTFWVGYDYEWEVVVSSVTTNSCTIKNLKPGHTETYAVRPYTKNGSEVKWYEYTTIETATKPPKTKVSAIQNTTAIKLSWEKSPTSYYRIYYKSGNKWKVAKEEVGNSYHIFTDLKPGSKYTFAVRPYIEIDGVYIWGEHTEFTTATKPAAVSAKVTSPSKSKLTLTWNAVSGAEGYQVFYKTGNGAYKYYNTYSNVKNLTFTGLKSGTKYTFAVRAGIRTSGGNIFGGYKEVPVTVK